MTDPQERTITIRSAVDLNIVGENILDIAAFAIEKYEFRHDTKLSDEARDKATAEIRDALWERIKAMQAKRQEWLKQMFDAADDALQRSVEAS